MAISKSREAVLKLAIHFKGDEIALQMINDTLNYFTQYIRLVNKQENILTTLKSVLSPQDLRKEIETLDNRRRITHNAMIAGVKAINRLCKEIGCAIFYSGDEEDRYEIADFAMVIVGETFAGRKR